MYIYPYIADSNPNKESLWSVLQWRLKPLSSSSDFRFLTFFHHLSMGGSGNKKGKFGTPLLTGGCSEHVLTWHQFKGVNGTLPSAGQTETLHMRSADPPVAAPLSSLTALMSVFPYCLRQWNGPKLKNAQKPKEANNLLYLKKWDYARIIFLKLLFKKDNFCYIYQICPVVYISFLKTCRTDASFHLC